MRSPSNQQLLDDKGSPDAAVVYTDDVAAKLSKGIRRRCFNCGAISSSGWRRSTRSPGKVLCNKCGLYERTPFFPNPARSTQKADSLISPTLPTCTPSAQRVGSSSPYRRHVVRSGGPQSKYSGALQGNNLLPESGNHHNTGLPSASDIRSSTASDASQSFNIENTNNNTTSSSTLQHAPNRRTVAP